MALFFSLEMWILETLSLMCQGCQGYFLGVSLTLVCLASYFYVAVGFGYRS